jgi:hypothetical protein
MVMYKVITELANILATKQKPANMAPAMVTERQPYLFTKTLATGPVKINQIMNQ